MVGIAIKALLELPAHPPCSCESDTGAGGLAGRAAARGRARGDPAGRIRSKLANDGSSQEALACFAPASLGALFLAGVPPTSNEARGEIRVYSHSNYSVKLASPARRSPGRRSGPATKQGPLAQAAASRPARPRRPALRPAQAGPRHADPVERGPLAGALLPADTLPSQSRSPHTHTPARTPARTHAHTHAWGMIGV